MVFSTVKTLNDGLSTIKTLTDGLSIVQLRPKMMNGWCPIGTLTAHVEVQ